jgi:hypothetical protein
MAALMNRQNYFICLIFNKKLYLKEDSNKKSENYQIIKNVTKEFINAIHNSL